MLTRGVTNVIYRVDEFTENIINPITKCKYDSSWLVLVLSSDLDIPMIVGKNNGCAYTIKISKQLHDDWRMAVGDFIGYCNANNLNGIIVITEDEYNKAQNYYVGHSYNDTLLRDHETPVLVHSTPMENWLQIQKDGTLKSWNKLNSPEKEPIGKQLGDPTHFSDYIMFGGGISGEIVVNSKQSGKIVMDIDAEYKTGARLYFDAEKMAKDGLIVRDGAHIKVRDSLPLAPYLIWAATWNKVGLESQISTPRVFAELSDKKFEKDYHYGQCHICGKYSKLTFEHIPPENALNNKRAKVYIGEEAVKRYKGEKSYYKNQQQGMGMYSLCESCNNNTGTWYAIVYNDFAKDVARGLYKEKPLEHGDVFAFNTKKFPALAFVKQVVTMFCSLLPHSEVKRLGFDELLLNKESNKIDKKLFDLRIYLTPENVGQLMVGPTVLGNISNMDFKTTVCCDLGVYPFGFILNLTPENHIEYGASLMNLFDAEFDKEYSLQWALIYLERTSDALPLPLMFKPLPEGQNGKDHC